MRKNKKEHQILQLEKLLKSGLKVFEKVLEKVWKVMEFKNHFMRNLELFIPVHFASLSNHLLFDHQFRFFEIPKTIACYESKEI